MTATILRLRSSRLTGGAAPEVVASLSCGHEMPFRLGSARVTLLGASVRCHSEHGNCACGMATRPGMHSEALCGLSETF